MQVVGGTHLEEACSQRLIIQDQIVKILNRINEVALKQKRIEAEIEEVRMKLKTSI